MLDLLQTRFVRGIQTISGYRGQIALRENCRDFVTMNCQHSLLIEA